MLKYPEIFWNIGFLSGRVGHTILLVKKLYGLYFCSFIRYAMICLVLESSGIYVSLSGKIHVYRFVCLPLSKRSYI